MLSWSFYASLRSGSEWRSFQRGEWRKVHQSKVTVTRNMSNSWINPGWIVVYPSWSNESFHFQDTKCNFLMQCLRGNRASLRQMDTFKFHVLLVFFPKNLRKVLRVTSTWSVGVVDFWSAGWCNSPQRGMLGDSPPKECPRASARSAQVTQLKQEEVELPWLSPCSEGNYPITWNTQQLSTIAYQHFHPPLI